MSGGVSIDAQANADPQVIPVIPRQEVELRPAVFTFDDFFSAEYARLVTLLTAYTGHRATAEELAQEAMLRAHQKWKRVANYDAPSAWLRRVALNLANNHGARRRTERRMLVNLANERSAGRPGIGEATEQDEFWAVVRQLPRRQAAAVALHYLEDRSVTDVATILGCAEGTAKAHLHKGRANLARLLENPENPDAS